MNARAPTLLVAAGLALAACRWRYPQRIPGPLYLPPGAEELPQEVPEAGHVTLQRDADPVWLRRPTERGFVPVPFYAKRQRVPAGTLVRTGAGGRAELLWLPDATALVLFEEGRATVGAVEVGEAVLALHSLTRALLTVTPEDRVQLVGGALLTGDPEEPTGPILIEALGSLQRVTNQSKRVVAIAYRTEKLALGPGESVDLPLVPGGAAPQAEPSTRLSGAGVDVLLEGEVERADEPDGLALTARGPAVLHARGLEVHLAPGGSARFAPLAPEPPPAVPEPNPPR